MNIMKVLAQYNKTSKNFMTPDVINYKVVDNKVIELSKGTDMSNKVMYAVTILEAHDDYMQSDGNGQLFQGSGCYQKALKFYQSFIA